LQTLEVSFEAANGSFSGTITDSNGNIVLAPQSLRSTFPGDTSYWSLTGSVPWTVDEDSVTAAVPAAGGENYLEGYADLSGDGYTSVTYRINLQGDNPDGTSNIEFTVTDSTGATLIDTNPNLPIGKFGPQQFTFTSTATPPNTIAHVTIELFVHAGSTITAWDGELFPTSGGTAGIWGTWASNPVDLYVVADQPVTGIGLNNLTNFGLYYADLSNADNADSIAHSLDVLSQYQALICNEAGLNTTSRQQYVQQQLLAKGVKLFGYDNIGVTESQYNYCLPPVSVVTAIIDRCAAAGYTGVFFDGAGQDGIPTEYMNYLADYCHAKSPAMQIIANAHPQDCISAAINTDVLSVPSIAPSVSAVTDAGSTLPAGVYDVAYTGTNYCGETPPSPTSSVTIAAGQGVQVATISGFDTGTQSINIYLSIAPGSTTLGLVAQGNGSATLLGNLPPNGAQNPPATNTGYVGNHLGIASQLNNSDWLLWESFYSRSDNQYAGVPEGGFANIFAEYVTGANLAKSVGVQMVALTYALNATLISDYSDWINAYVLASGLGFQGLVQGNASNMSEDARPWVTPPPFPALGNSLLAQMAQVDANTYEATSDQGVIQFIAKDSPASRTYARFGTGAVKARVTSIPRATASRVDLRYQTSNDEQTWADVADLNSVTQRYLRLQLTLRD